MQLSEMSRPICHIQIGHRKFHGDRFGILDIAIEYGKSTILKIEIKKQKYVN